jgi:acetylornithine/N-succinyldiaminopimelate aminotransferase
MRDSRKISKENLFAFHRDHVMSTYFPTDLIITRGAMSRLWDIDGNEYLDFTSGISVCNLGHCHPRVTEAIQRQAATLVHVSNLFMNENQPRLAALLSSCSFGGKVFFCNSGAEANEGMIKFARRWGNAQGGKYEIICMQDSFHGRTLATLAATGRAKYRKGFEPDTAGFVHVPFNSLAALEQAITPRTAAVLLEPIQGEGGVIPADPDYLRAVRELCDEKKVLLLFDEVQCGMGRTGRYFAYQHYGVEPDAMSMAKALANGFPLGALEVRNEYASVLEPGTHASTFGGNPLACAAGIAVFETIADEAILESATKMAARLWNELHALQEKHGTITQIRGVGLMIGVVCTRPAKEIVAAARQRGLLILTAGEDVVRLLPPLTIDEDDIAEAIAVLDEVLAATA